MKSFVPHEFKFDQIVKNPHILIIAAEEDSRRFVVDNIIKYLKTKFDDSYDISIISPAEKINAFYQQKYPNATIHYDLAEKKTSNGNSNQIIVLDDCLADLSNWHEDETIMDILINARWYNTSCITTFRHPPTMVPNLCYYFDYVFLFTEDSISYRRKIWKMFTNMFPNMSISWIPENLNNWFIFEKIFSEYTKNFCCMVIDKRIPYRDFNDRIFWFRTNYEILDSDTFNPPRTIYFDNDLFNYTTEYSDEYSDQIFPEINSNEIYEDKTNKKNSFKINYNDNSINFSVSTNNADQLINSDENHLADNNDMIEKVCKYIIDIKKIQLVYLKIVIEYLRLKLSNNTIPRE